LILVQVSRLHCVVQILFIAVVPGVCAVKIFPVGICDFWRFNLVAFVLGIELIFVSAFYTDLIHAVTCYFGLASVLGTWGTFVLIFFIIQSIIVTVKNLLLGVFIVQTI
jgi:hypothetical protein